jgi:hypothetical protein
LLAEPVTVRHLEGLVHGFLALRELDGTTLAIGEMTQVSSGGRVTNELVFRFKDGSIHEEKCVFTQRRTFRLLTYHLVQKGKAFKRFTDMSLNASTGEVTVRYTEDDGKEKTVTDRLNIQPDIANGLVQSLFNDIDPKVAKTTVTLVASTPKPRLVKLAISPDGEDSFSVGGTARKATRFVVKVEIGGISGIVAPIVGKQPPDTHVWILSGKAPVFLKSEGPLYEGGPVWRIEQISPSWPKP